MIDPKKDHTSPIGHLPRRPKFEDVKDASDAVTREDVKQTVVEHKAAVVELLRNAIAKVPKKAGRGRPRSDKPWEAEGVSRMTWYRRAKKRFMCRQELTF